MISKLNKTFSKGDILTASDINLIISKIKEVGLNEEISISISDSESKKTLSYTKLNDIVTALNKIRTKNSLDKLNLSWVYQELLYATDLNSLVLAIDETVDCTNTQDVPTTDATLAFIDMDLPSGIQWANINSVYDNSEYITLADAKKVVSKLGKYYFIPAFKQYEELNNSNYCNGEVVNGKLVLSRLTDTSKTISFPLVGYIRNRDNDTDVVYNTGYRGFYLTSQTDSTGWIIYNQLLGLEINNECTNYPESKMSLRICYDPIQKELDEDKYLSKCVYTDSNDFAIVTDMFALGSDSKEYMWGKLDPDLNASEYGDLTTGSDKSLAPTLCSYRGAENHYSTTLTSDNDIVTLTLGSNYRMMDTHDTMCILTLSDSSKEWFTYDFQEDYVVLTNKADTTKSFKLPYGTFWLSEIRDHGTKASDADRFKDAYTLIVSKEYNTVSVSTDSRTSKHGVIAVRNISTAETMHINNEL